MRFYFFPIVRMNYLLTVLISAIAVLIAAYVTPGVVVDGFVSALLVAIILGVLNATLGAVLRVLTFPINFVTVGLMSAIIGFLMVLLTDSLVPGFSISNTVSGIVFAILLGVISVVLLSSSATHRQQILK